MPDTPESPAPERSEPEIQLADLGTVQELARSLGQVVNNTFLYGTAHKVTRVSLDRSYEILVRFFEQWERVNFSMAEDNLLADGRATDPKNPLIKSFARQLKAIGVSGFSLERGMAREEFDKLMGLINTHPDKMREMGSFSEAVAQTGLAHVQARTASYQLVTEEDLVVRKGDLEQALTQSGSAGGVGDVDRVLEYLTTRRDEDGGAAAEGVAQDMASVAQDAAQMADVILKASQMQKDALGEAGRSFVDLIVSSIRLAYESLCQDPSVKTQQGKKSLSKTLMLLEQEILSRFKDVAGEADSSGAETIAATMEEMINELTIDALAKDYAKKRNAIENTEKKIVKFIGNVEREEPEAIDVLKEEFLSRGLTEEGWEELLEKTRARKKKKEKPEEPLPSPEVPASELHSLLSHLIEVVASTRQVPATPEVDSEIVQILTKVDQEVSQVVTRTEERIEALAEEIRQATEEPPKGKGRAGAKLAMSRKRLLAILAEIGQELCQPLSVINCTLDMLKSKILGEVTPQQEEMIVLAATSGERLRVIIDKLLLISGVPASTQPNTQILKSLYE